MVRRSRKQLLPPVYVVRREVMFSQVSVCSQEGAPFAMHYPAQPLLEAGQGYPPPLENT